MDIKIKGLKQKIQNFLKEVYVELKKVNWLSRKEVLRYTLIVLVVSLVVAAFLGGLDYIFSEIIKRFVF
ncbi:MAG: preprotein translocase, SecE subunit [Parcubacteria group bacterium Licking1014_1]|nr:MAG: preprotein translocase, SecE subunit [Parcubacteria group bacterium Licking1014_1]